MNDHKELPELPTPSWARDLHGETEVHSVAAVREIQTKAYEAGKRAALAASQPTVQAGENTAQEAYYYNHYTKCAEGQGYRSIPHALDELARLTKAEGSRGAPELTGMLQRLTDAAETHFRGGVSPLAKAIADARAMLAAAPQAPHVEPVSEHVATYYGVEFSRYCFEWVNGYMPIGTKFYAVKPEKKNG